MQKDEQKSGSDQGSEAAAEGPGNISVDEPTEPVLDPEDEDLGDESASDEDAER